MIRQIQINNFRNYGNLKLNIDSDIVVLHGQNGEGKTNILEAISMFSHGRGLRRAKFEEMIRLNSNESFWNIIMETDEDEFSSGYIKSEKSGKRIFKVSEKQLRNLNEFSKNNYVLWMTYETDRLFLQSPSDRREFIDMFCNTRFPDHSDILSQYEKLIRERQKILKEYYENFQRNDIELWLNIIEEKISKLGLEVARNRIEITQELEICQFKNHKFPEFTNKMTGRLEAEIMSCSEECHEKKYMAELFSRRQKDFITKTTTLGPNRSDWKVSHIENKIDAALCSAGEQKMLLSGVFLSFIKHNIKSDNRNLILLLDDVIAHLDSNHRTLLFEHIKDLVNSIPEKINVWLSGTDRNLFAELSDRALFILIRNNDAFAE